MTIPILEMIQALISTMILSLIFILCCKWCYQHSIDCINVIEIAAYALFIVLFIGLFAFVGSYKQKEVQKVKQEFTGYLDGEQVNLDNIDLSLYNVRYNYPEKELYLTIKKYKDRSYIPIPIRR